MTPETIRPAVRHHQPWYKILYVQVLIAIALGVGVGYFYPHLGKELKPLGDAFIALIKMMIAPVIFCTVVHGISSMGDLKRVGRVGLKALIYFEVVSTVALAIGLIVGEVLQPGHGFNIDPSTIDPKSVSSYVTQAKEQGIVSHLMAIIPDSYLGALARGDLLQVLLVSILSGQDVLRHHPHDRARRTARGVRRDGVYGRRLWPQFAVEPDRADRHFLSHQHIVRVGRARFDCAPLRLFDHSLYPLYQG
jgi:L-cystine uptake protein TcyP (sodium:dicarboxylate symporter family)